MFIQCVTMSLMLFVLQPTRGINLPPTQGTTNSGAFLPGVYSYDYSEKDFEKMIANGFGQLRIAINGETALDVKSLVLIESFFERTGNRGVICFFDTKREGQSSHGDGKPNNIEELAACWENIHSVFQKHRQIQYELFNEPFGYARTLEGAKQYVEEMLKVIELASLPQERCILDGIGFADNVKMVSEAGWEGNLAYHFYPTWQHDGKRTQENFSNKIQHDLKGLSNRVHLTEFGANLCVGDVFEMYAPEGTVATQDQNALRGLHDALLALKKSGSPIKSSFLWHGWNNGDSYSLWNPKAAFGAQKVEQIQECTIEASKNAQEGSDTNKVQ